MLLFSLSLSTCIPFCLWFALSLSHLVPFWFSLSFQSLPFSTTLLQSYPFVPLSHSLQSCLFLPLSLAIFLSASLYPAMSLSVCFFLQSNLPTKIIFFIQLQFGLEIALFLKLEHFKCIALMKTSRVVFINNLNFIYIYIYSFCQVLELLPFVQFGYNDLVIIAQGFHSIQMFHWPRG